MQTSTRVWSTYQQDIFSFIQSGTGSATIEAVAGSGKTTTIVEALSRCNGSTIFLAFNKAIAEELKKRGVNARTFHSLTYSIVTRHKGTRTVNPDKLWNLVNEYLGDRDAEIYGSFIVRLVGLARQAGVGCLVHDTDEVWADIVDHHDLEPDSEEAVMSRAIALARKLLQASNASPEVDFDDLLYIPVLEGLTLPKFDFVFVDEAQDTNAIQRALLRKLTHDATRIIAVGDPAQAIYGFRGADSESMQLIAADFNCTTLPLTVSYRCPRAVVEYARRWVQHIEAAPGASEGAVTSLGDSWSNELFRQDDLVVCRTTKPLVALAYRLIKARIGARILGREIGNGLKSLIKRMRAKGIDGLLTKLAVYTAREIEKAKARGQDSKAAAIEDKTDTVLVLISSLSENDRTIPALLAAIDALFSDSKSMVTLATIHKSKGLEAGRVIWLNSSQCPAKWARREWQQQQELNLCYVATTRAINELVLIEDSPATNGNTEE
jgi:superfamily I DNA/RNA helicase